MIKVAFQTKLIIYNDIFNLDDRMPMIQKVVDIGIQPVLTKHSVSFPNKIVEMELEDDANFLSPTAREDSISENLYKQLCKEWSKCTREYLETNHLAINYCFNGNNQQFLNAKESLSDEKGNYHKSKQNILDHSMKRAVSLKSGMPKIGCLSKYEAKITQLACKDYRSRIRF